jgi:hypothetical protein
MVEILLHFYRIIQLVGILLQMMRLAPVLEENAVLSQAAHGQIKFDALIPGNSTILVSELDQKGSLDTVCKKNRRIFDISLRVLPKAAADPAL